MGVKLDIKRKVLSRTERVKSVDMHPTEPWLLASLYDGKVFVWNYETQSQIKTFEVSELPVRAAKFIARKNWIVTGADDLQIRVYNYNTQEKVVGFDAHQDYIRAIAVHPTQPYVLTGSDDMSIKLWDWEKKWRCVMQFEGHGYFVMSLAINPKDPNTFASGSLDKTIKVWNLGSSMANFTLEGHEKGVNAVEYYRGNDKPYLISGADDFSVRVWDYQNNTCVQKLTGHVQNVISVGFHPTMPIIYSGSEDGTLKLWNSNTYRQETTLSYGLGRIWAVSGKGEGNLVAIGADDGVVVVSLGNDQAVVSMDGSGRVVWAKNNEIQTTTIKQHSKDGERLGLTTKDLGPCEVYPTTIRHSPNGRFVAVCGDGEYIIYTALAWRNKTFGNALEFVWAQNSANYAVRESAQTIKLFAQFKQQRELGLGYSAEEMFGGTLLGVRSAGDTLNLYDWDSGSLVRRIDVAAIGVYWSDSDLVAVATSDSFYVLKYNRAAVVGANITDEGVEDAIEFVVEIQERIVSATWIGGCLIYTNAANRLNYLVGGQCFTIAHFANPMQLLGYISRNNCVYLVDKDYGVVGYSLPLAMIEYQTAILRRDLESAASLLPDVPSEMRPRLARFLEAEDLKDLALLVTTDREHKFDLAIQLQHLDIARSLAEETGSAAKWRAVADCAMGMYAYSEAEECLYKARDYASLLMFYSANSSQSGLERLLAELEQAQTQANQHPNIMITVLLLLHKTDRVLELLLESRRYAEAALFARSYVPDQVVRVVGIWKQAYAGDSVSGTNKGFNAKKSALINALAAPTPDYINLFPQFASSLELQKPTTTTTTTTTTDVDVNVNVESAQSSPQLLSPQPIEE